MSSASDTREAATTAGGGAEPAVTVTKDVMARVKDHHISLMGAGVAFFGFLAFIPALVAVVSVYGLVANPDDIESSVEGLTEAVPDEVRSLIVQQLQSITDTSSGALSLGLVISLAVAIWAASSGMSHLVEAVNVAHDETESRNMVHRRLLGIGLTVGAIVFAVLAVAAIAVWPTVVNAIDPPSPVDWLLKLAVWPVLAACLMVALAVLYHVAPDREVQYRWISTGAGIAVLLWLVASIGFQFYASNFGSYNETYGSLGAIVIMLLWLWISATVVLVGAEINAVLEERA